MNDPLRAENLDAKQRAEENKRKIEKSLADRRVADIKHICSTPQGRRFIWELFFNDCGIYGSIFVPGAPDITAFNEGKRAVGMRVLYRLNLADKSIMQQLLLEHWSEEVSNQSAKDKILGEA